MERPLDGIDRFLDPRSINEIPLVALATFDDLVEKIADQVGVKQAAPRRARVPARRVKPLREFQLFELDIVRRGDLDRLGNTELFDEPADDRALFAVQPNL